MYQKILETNERFTGRMLEHQALDSDSKYYGGIIDPVMGVAKPSHVNTPRIIASWVASILNPDSEYYHDENLADRLEKAFRYMLKSQHQDGTISLGGTNYHSPPDTAFVVVGLSQIYVLLKDHNWDRIDRITRDCRLFLERTIPALLTGGCHTPNHRWVMTSALSFLYKIVNDEKLVRRAEEWLAEGLDYTDDGEWTERSNGIYNAVNNKMLYHAAINLERPDLLIPVRKNLDMMQFLIHPSGEVVTDYSGRQDLGTVTTLSNYYAIYRLMAHHDQNAEYASMADLAADDLKEPGSVDNNPMITYLTNPAIEEEMIDRKPIPETYVKTFNQNFKQKEHLALMDTVGHHNKIRYSAPHTAFGSPLVRYRKDNLSATVMTNTPSFLSIRHGKAKLLGVKISTAFSPGIVRFDKFEETENGYRLTKVMEKGYNAPIPKDKLAAVSGLPGNQMPWYLLPHQHRACTHVQKHQITATITPGEKEWKLQINSDQLEEVFTQVTFIFSEEGSISGEGIQQIHPNQFLLKEGPASFMSGEDKIQISPGKYEHWLDVLREDSHLPGCQYLSVNLMTPFNHCFEISLL